ncbi:MAG: radical SAM protein [Bacteroidales bacterium]|nr:radical SAM protein [Candidatus Scybalousia scybalohippi]
MKTSDLIGLSRHRIGIDGAGVTTLIAFHECPLDCKYCLNPQALSSKGVWKKFTPKELYNIVKKDDLYFRATGGGVTFGGGEPLLSCKEILHFHKLCQDEGKRWKFNIETSLNVPGIFAEVLVGLVNHWIVDIKDMNPEIYKSYTDKDNKFVIDNLKFLIEHKAKITVRVPLIPNFNTESDVEKSVQTLQCLGITDIERFTYIIKTH